MPWVARDKRDRAKGANNAAAAVEHGVVTLTCGHAAQGQPAASRGRRRLHWCVECRGYRETPYLADPDFTLYLGDALDVLRELDDESAHCAITSPPYYLLRDYETDGQIGQEATLDEYLGRLLAVFAELHRILRADGVFWLNVGDTHCTAQRGQGYGHTSKLSTPQRQELVSSVVDKRHRARGVKLKDLFGVPFELALALRDAGWWWRQTVIWDKTQVTPESAKDRPTTSHEYLFLFAKSRRYWFDAEAIAEPATWDRWGAQTQRKDVVGKAAIAKRLSKPEIERRWPGISKGTHDARAAASSERGDESDPIAAGVMRNSRSVWRGNSAQFPEAHFAVMPDWLAEKCVLAACPLAGTVIDPFLGAGTTALAARRHGRSCIGDRNQRGVGEDRRAPSRAAVTGGYRVSVAFTVYGVAAPGGSKRGFVNKRSGRVIITDASARSRPWKAQITDAAAQAMNGRELLEGPLLLEVVFWLPRPKGHFGTGRNAGAVKPGAPSAPAVKPDCLKLARLVEDAMSGIVYRDDAQITCETLQKAYTTGQARTEVRVVPITHTADQPTLLAAEGGTAP